MNGNNQERKTRAAMKFLAWAQEWSPEWHAKIVEAVGEAPAASPLGQLGAAWGEAPGLSYGEGPGLSYGLGQTEAGAPAPAPTTSWADKLFSFAEQAIPAYFAYETQQDISKINIERAKQGLSPIDPGAVAPQVKVVHQASPEMQQELRRFGTGGINLLLWAGLGLGAFLLIRGMR